MAGARVLPLRWHKRNAAPVPHPACFYWYAHHLHACLVALLTPLFAGVWSAMHDLADGGCSPSQTTTLLLGQHTREKEKEAAPATEHYRAHACSALHSTRLHHLATVHAWIKGQLLLRNSLLSGLGCWLQRLKPPPPLEQRLCHAAAEHCYGGGGLSLLALFTAEPLMCHSHEEKDGPSCFLVLQA